MKAMGKNRRSARGGAGRRGRACPSGSARARAPRASKEKLLRGPRRPRAEPGGRSSASASSRRGPGAGFPGLGGLRATARGPGGAAPRPHRRARLPDPPSPLGAALGLRRPGDPGQRRLRAGRAASLAGAAGAERSPGSAACLPGPLGVPRPNVPWK